MSNGTLFVCPTPIGNLEDITLRTLKVLNEVDIIAAEDTRHTLKLLNHYEIKKPLTSYHEHNKWEKGQVILEKLKLGKNIALVSDAGMPGISDPGEELIGLAIAEDIHVVALPGATASITALILSGLPTRKFVFEGFLSSNKKERISELERLRGETRTIILYEAPHRLMYLLKDMKEVLGNRNISISRELTKVYEETFRGTIEEAILAFKDNRRGEFVIIIEGGKIEEVNPYENISIKEHIKAYLEEGMTKKDAVKKVASDRNLAKNIVYKESIDL
ncbi:16S rRNA (cytidine(1402)-2'-O)-methyltransferase [Anaerosalibacter sp. Marseille-P3206]|uniref:16S rRNA (cytidine(1402)-2'-O)-methyltransferase n=1 Tax=Anaerosalibacter sp. Marseille-P3206 TaxID=1871005 RepID=UPI000985B5AC|nr:16S rRNA (cytidine(1402)-2'-O)-methyltransferase [Anaerosalibacter sp. Marseille-P3206]